MKYSRETANCASYELLRENAKRMRLNPTEAEAAAWNLFRTSFPDTKFRRQHIIGDFIVDFVCLEYNLVIEIDGAYHFTEQQKNEDRIRSAYLNQKGLKVLRFTNEEILFGQEEIISKLKEFIQ